MFACARRTCALSIATIACVAEAGSLPYVGEVSSRTTISPRSLAELPLSCPPNLQALSGFVTPWRLEGVQVLAKRTLPINLDDGVHAAATGMTATVQNTGNDDLVTDFTVFCASPRTASVSVMNHTLQPRERRRVQVSCPSGQVAVGGGYYALGGPVFSDYPKLFAFGLPQAPDGAHPAPDGREIDAQNFSFDAVSVVTAIAICYQHADAFTLVGTATLEAGETAFRGLAVGDDVRILGHGVAGGTEGHVRGGAFWNVGNGLNFMRDPGPLEIGGGGLAGDFVRDLRMPGSMMTAPPNKIALIVEPYDGEPPPVRIDQVKEYRNSSSRFYFSTLNPREIVDLDTGVHFDWTRTGESFNAYAAGSGGPVGRQPVSRFYSETLGSHFYTGGVKEGLDVRYRFGQTWRLESGEVAQWQLPDPRTGTCDPSTDRIWRTVDTVTGNHRLGIRLEIRDQTIANEGHVPEGYGLGIVGCAPRSTLAQ